MAPEVPPRPELVVLDVNETLSDLAPLRDAFASVGLGEHEVEAWFAGLLRDAFALTVLGDNPEFADIASASLQARLSAAGIGVNSSETQQALAQEVMAQFLALRPHPDVVPALVGLAHSGCRIVTLSNGSSAVARALLEGTEADAVIERYLSVTDAGAWKPHPSAYAYALSETGVPAERAMLVAVHPWDLAGARRAGLRTAWIARGSAAYPGHFPAAEVEASSMTELADLFAGH
ncbi:haloacid dehalogenase type II [Nocardioides panacisoli]|uniref:haloacid dehalogenase type II n=1 Tax=Nocardioides panacisoli TaxID=627624 RepID=UPI001C628A9A|nr:haloacid dehalogenase type II [Nocardioides panacisoli]QYJ05340.1 haloacid dehalogenase type II [Nocardioides panacisoli]